MSRGDSNGLKLVDKHFVKEIKDRGITFLLASVDSSNPEIHDRLRGMRGSWYKAIQGIKNCVGIGIPVGISTVVTKQSLKTGDAKKIIQLGKDLAVFRIRLLIPMLVGRWHKREEIKLSKEKLKEFWSLLEPNFVFGKNGVMGRFLLCVEASRGRVLPFSPMEMYNRVVISLLDSTM